MVNVKRFILSLGWVVVDCIGVDPNSGIVGVDNDCIDVDCGTDDARSGATTKGTPFNVTFDPALIAEQLPFVGLNDATVDVINEVVSLFCG